jgi:nucleoside-diphosphate-sugar epimerase
VCDLTGTISGGIDMHIALTGSSGFVGSHVLAELVAHGHEVTAIVRNEEDAISVATQGAKAPRRQLSICTTKPPL